MLDPELLGTPWDEDYWKNRKDKPRTLYDIVKECEELRALGSPAKYTLDPDY